MMREGRLAGDQDDRPLGEAGLLIPEQVAAYEAFFALLCLAHRAFWASEMRRRASADIFRGPRFALPADVRVLAARAPPLEPAFADPWPVAFRRAAQYLLMRSLTALR